MGALESRFYAALLAGLGVDPSEAPQFPPSGWPALHARFAAIFATRDRDDWATHFEGTEACVTPVLSFAEAAGHPHNAARSTFGGSPIQPTPAPRFDGDVQAPEPTSTDTLGAALARWA